MIYEAVLRDPDTAAAPGPAVPSTLPYERLHRLQKDAQGRAVILLVSPASPVGIGSTAPNALRTYEAYEAVRDRLATLGPTKQAALLSSSDSSAADANRQADVAAWPSNPGGQQGG